MTSMQRTIRRRVFFFGNVQGVGFRYTTCSIARDFNVQGFVRNRSDGGVELVVEGYEGEIERFLGAIREYMRSHIDREMSDEPPPTGEFSGFAIR